MTKGLVRGQDFRLSHSAVGEVSLGTERATQVNRRICGFSGMKLRVQRLGKLGWAEDGASVWC